MMRYLSIIIYCATTLISYSQSRSLGYVEIQKSELLDTLFSVKKEINRSAKNNQLFDIQIYSGSKTSSDIVLYQFEKYYKNNFYDKKIYSKIIFETPNYKVRVGDFLTRLDADRWLIWIRRRFPGAFIHQNK